MHRPLRLILLAAVHASPAVAQALAEPARVEADGGTGSEPAAAPPAQSGQSAPDAGVAVAPVDPGYTSVVTARRPYTAASSVTVRDEDFATRPISDPSDLLEVTPGLFTVQHAGGGKANQYFLRGFDIDHGTDLALSFDGVPINLVSHAHGQGYADLHFIIPETVERLEVSKGPYDAELGDFATAGAVNLVTRRSFDLSSAELSYGSFNTWRALLIAAPGAAGGLEGYAAAEVYGTDGAFLSPERMRRFSLLSRVTLSLGERTELSAILTAYGSGWNASGQVPLRAVEAGTLSRFGSVDPTEGGNSQRHSAAISLRHRGLDGSELSLRAYLVHYRLQLFSNFTFFASDPVRGDQIEQADVRTLGGFEARHQRGLRLGEVRSQLTSGIRLRHDLIDNSLFHTAQRERLERRVDAGVGEGSLGAFLEADTEWTPWLRSVLGVRGDYLGFQVDDRLEDLSTEAGATSGHAQALVVSPKASVVLSPLRQLDLFLNFGRGFHSNDARGVVREVDPVTPLAAATGYELGLRTRLFRRLDLAAAAWALDLDSELVWVGDEGTTEARPATQRRGLEAEVRYRFTPWLRADADLTWTHARFTEPTAGGERVPLAPTLTWAGGVQADHPSGAFGALRVQGMADRPANEDGSIVAQGFTLLDLEAGYDTRHLRITFAVRNLLDAEWRSAQFANTSRLPEEPAPVEDLHFTPGYPRAFTVSLTGRL